MKKPVDATLHGVVDYQAGALLMTVLPGLTGIEGTRAARQIRTAGAIHAGYSTITDYPLGVVKVLPFKAHLALDAVGAVALAATPFLTGEWRRGRRHWATHVGLALFELASLAMTDPTGRGDFHGDVDAVRRANMRTRTARSTRDRRRSGATASPWQPEPPDRASKRGLATTLGGKCARGRLASRAFGSPGRASWARGRQPYSAACRPRVRLRAIRSAPPSTAAGVSGVLPVGSPASQ
jgi:hypothetical protein